ncbi:endoplasmic reticulum vesicle transporter-domain-containing protein [Chytriomyces sp. MP71]|nr:endoplasmic reticulum vesicle transporter-domain-containing protein [Chytriomyces sp. MP71]
MLKSITRFDAFPKIDKNMQKSTGLGGLLTLLVALGLFFLTLSEFGQYIRITQKYEFLVDRSTSAMAAQMSINADVTVAMACENLRIDVLDVAGTSLHARNNEFTKTPVRFHTVGIVDMGARKSKSKLDVHKVVAEAQRKHREHVDTAGAPTACRIKGHINVNRVAGMFHITALGHGYMDGKHVSHEAMNFTHRVDKLSFGIDYPGLVNPLDSSLEVADGNFEMFQYFMSIVPTIYVDGRRTFGSVILTNQYAVTDYKKIVGHETREAGIPGIFMKYEIEPIVVRVTESRASFMHFLTRLCGITGGIYVTVGLLNNLIQFSMKVYERFGN